MAKVDEQIAAAEFRVDSVLTFDQVQKAAEDAAHRSEGVMTKIKLRGVDQDRGLIQFAIKQSTALVNALEFTVQYIEGADDEPNAVRLAPGEYMTTRQTAFFIPISPQQCAGAGPLTKFSQAFKTAVTA